ncbi:MAG TPA: chlorite dismutase family protein [Saprospiraceae bacterium]|nr:chlorite dismutase family protein [Saprospiraceae bacterium]HMP24009.1 chlorite dismutase family protein [Saprospiraceae bacterium]
MMTNFFDFIGDASGEWQVTFMQSIIGAPLEAVTHLQILPSTPVKIKGGIWLLKGFTSNVRYAQKDEIHRLRIIQADLGRPEATCAALIPIRKSAEWWSLAQDERRRIFEEQSRHTENGLRYLPAIARRLYHCRDIGEPFDFLTWFEYAPEYASAFEELVAFMRQTEEWVYVEREVDIRLEKVK